ncbi:hypothetical protein CVU83_02015 [Candidatus Falkowbacteria bacterium HGW-Falkowbacteria-2]|uniref:Uncharacterized protein n=1 Tax=Candidatus Falkowbacteria bacterium HGW-Falkowbacteria-2 TaxID=2013769 RepID=A0A2N2E0E8_9BACT|nr:MAG: hypothetical protein CVU83_02015 [Candidatus Falkowbacteria bacterium HGW-Falkowbacteria-2]
MFNEKEEAAIKTMAKELSISPDNKKEIIERTLALEALEVHKHGLSKRSFAIMKARLLGLTKYVCNYSL